MIADFYDVLADNYHRIFPDWSASVDRQSLILERLLLDHGVAPGMRVLDCSAGIGTQAIGMAQRGFDVTATDVSERSIEHARDAATARSLELAFDVADFRQLDVEALGTFDAVISFDNAIAHMLADEDLLAAFRSMRACAKPGAPVFVSTRSYQGELPRPNGLPPRTTTAEPRWIYTQAWTWHDDRGPLTYDTDLFLLEAAGSQWIAHHARTTMRVWLFDELVEIAVRAGWSDVQLLTAEESGFYQPVLVGRA